MPLAVRYLSMLAFAAATFASATTARAEPVVFGGYYEDNAVCGSASNSCSFAFSPIVGSEPVLTTQVSCWANVKGTLLHASLSDGTATRQEFLARSYATNDAGGNAHNQVGGAVSFLYRRRQQPFVVMRFENGGFMTGQCRITGQRPPPY